jgi:hypothetical protein
MVTEALEKYYQAKYRLSASDLSLIRRQTMAKTVGVGITAVLHPIKSLIWAAN